MGSILLMELCSASLMEKASSLWWRKLLTESQSRTKEGPFTTRTLLLTMLTADKLHPRLRPRSGTMINLLDLLSLITLSLHKRTIYFEERIIHKQVEPKSLVVTGECLALLL